ncbi:hypothetical protein D3C85_1090590 [compost metagenome]
MGECLIGRQQSVPAREHIALKPSFQRLFAQYLHDASGGRQVAPIGVAIQALRHPGFSRDFVDGGQAVAGRLIRAEQAKPVAVPCHDVA